MTCQHYQQWLNWEPISFWMHCKPPLTFPTWTNRLDSQWGPDGVLEVVARRYCNRPNVWKLRFVTAKLVFLRFDFYMIIECNIYCNWTSQKIDPFPSKNQVPTNICISQTFEHPNPTSPWHCMCSSQPILGQGPCSVQRAVANDSFKSLSWILRPGEDGKRGRFQIWRWESYDCNERMSWVKRSSLIFSKWDADQINLTSHPTFENPNFRHTHSFWMFSAGEAVSVIRASGMTADRATRDMFFCFFASKHRGALETWAFFPLDKSFAANSCHGLPLEGYIENIKGLFWRVGLLLEEW